MSKELYETKQFKLTSGEEVIAEVVQWNMDDETEIVVRKAMKLVMGETEGGNYRYYSFRPWMVYQENLQDFIILNAAHIVGIAQPVDSILIQYEEALISMQEMFESRETQVSVTGNGDVNEMTQKLRDHLKSIEEENDDEGNDDNVLPFIDPKTLH
jgi:hypothetical protein